MSHHDSSKTNTYPSALAAYDQVVANADLFMQTLEQLHRSMGTKFMVPTLGGKALDLHRLFVEVTSHGGLEKVIRDRKWKAVISVFSFPSTITNASFVLRKYYISLLHHYEQLYFFRKQGQPVMMDASFTGANTAKASSNLPQSTQEQVPTMPSYEKVAVEFQSQGQANVPLSAGCSVMGTIDGKFDNGYLVTVNFGSEKLKGVLYHVPETSPASRSLTADAVRRRNRRRSRRALNEPSRPKPNRSGYNFFFQEHCAKLLHNGEDSVISKKIGYMWSQLSEAEKEVHQLVLVHFSSITFQNVSHFGNMEELGGEFLPSIKVYQEKGMKDKERYRNEMVEYRKSSAL